MPFVPKVSGQNIALVAVFASLIVLSTIPPEFDLAAGVPISLQTLAVVLAGLALGAWRGFAAATVYLLLGVAHVPVFADGASGWGTFTGYTGGYLWSFPLAAFAVGWIAERIRGNASGIASYSALVGAGLVSLPIIYAIGVPWLAYRLDVPVFTAATEGGPTAIAWGLIPFVIGDILKIVAAAAIASYVHRAYPQLLAGGASVLARAAAPAGTGDGSQSTSVDSLPAAVNAGAKG